jgi:hypothetical protein
MQEPSAAPSGSSVENRATSYKGVVPTNEAVPGGNLLVTAYILVFLVVLLMIIRVFQRQTAVAKKLDELEADLKKKK